MSDSARASPAPLLRAGWIGTGIMGLPMAGHLLAAGHPLAVFTRTLARAEPLLARGAVAVASPADLVPHCDVIFTCVSDTPDVQAVLAGPRGVLDGVRAHRPAALTVVDHSTISPQATQALARQLNEAGVAFLDAPVSGGQVGAEKGTLSIMVGGAPADLARVQPLLARMGKAVVHCGPVGYGQFTKLANQIAGAVNMIAVAEAISFGAKAGLDLDKMLAAIGSGAATSWALVNLGPRAAHGDFAPGFMVDLMQKDLRLVLQAAGQLGVPLPGTALAQQLFAVSQARGDGRLGTQAMVGTLRRLAGP